MSVRPRRISRSALEDARRFFEERGKDGCEGTAMLAGPADGAITRCVIPSQVARRTKTGVCVEVTMQGKLELAAALGTGERYHARIHSHPRAAFHSDTDDANPGLTAEGALSIVVPEFGRGLRSGLTACAVFERRLGRWVEIPEADVRARLQVIG